MKPLKEQSEWGIQVNSNGSKDQSVVLERFSKCAADVLGCLQSSDKSLHKDGEKKNNSHISRICMPGLISQG